MSARGRLTIGLGVAHDAVRAAALRGGRLAWVLERARGDEPLARTIGLVLAEAPLARWPRPRVIAAVGPSHAQTKRLLGLPTVSDPSRLGDIVRESASRFFLRNGVPLMTTWRSSSNGAPWGAALELPVLEAIEHACRGCRVKLEAIVPTVSVLGLAVESLSGPRHIMWKDGDIHSDVAIEGNETVAVHRTNARHGMEAVGYAPCPELQALGPDGWRFVDALAAARARRSGLLAWQPGRAAGNGRAVPTWRLALATSAVIVAGAAVLAAPGAAARLAERQAMVRLTSLAPARRDAALAQREVGKVTAALIEAAAFDAPRYSTTRLLADLTRALPDESSLIVLKATGASVSLVALTPRAASVLAKVESVAGIEGGEIVGPVTREVVAGKTLERATLRFRLDPAVRRAHPTVSDAGT